MPRKLSDEQIEAYLDSRPCWAILSTIDNDGFPHSVPLGYFRLGRDIIMGVRDGTRKVANVECNPNVSILLEDGTSMADIRSNCVVGLRKSRGRRGLASPTDRWDASRCAVQSRAAEMNSSRSAAT